MSKQSSIITVAFTKTSLRGRVMRAVMFRSDRIIENNKEKREGVARESLRERRTK